MKSLSQKNSLWCVLFLSASLLLSCSDFASDDRKSVDVILKKDGKVYLFSALGTFITESKLNKNESPPVVASTRIVEKDNKLFVEPQYVEAMSNLISGNYVLHNHLEKSFDGYVTEGKHKLYDKSYTNKSTEKIGEMNSIANIFLKDINQTREHHISWQRNPNQSPLKNCVEMALWVDKSYKPGERTAAKEDFIMINLNDLVQFYNSNIRLDYDEKEEVLYLQAE